MTKEINEPYDLSKKKHCEAFLMDLLYAKTIQAGRCKCGISVIVNGGPYSYPLDDVRTIVERMLDDQIITNRRRIRNVLKIWKDTIGFGICVTEVLNDKQY